MTGKPITLDEIQAIFDRCDGAEFSDNLAQVDTRPQGGDAKQAPFTGSAVAESDAPKGDQ